MKKERKTTSFEPDPDVRDMINRAQQAGLTLGTIVNHALRDYGRDVIKKLANDKTKSLKSLASASFNPVEGQHLDMAA